MVGQKHLSANVPRYVPNQRNQWSMAKRSGSALLV